MRFFFFLEIALCLAHILKHHKKRLTSFSKLLNIIMFVDNNFTGLKVVFRDWKSDVFLMYFSSAYLFHFNFCGIIYRNLNAKIPFNLGSFCFTFVLADLRCLQIFPVQINMLITSQALRHLSQWIPQWSRHSQLKWRRIWTEGKD